MTKSVHSPDIIILLSCSWRWQKVTEETSRRVFCTERPRWSLQPLECQAGILPAGCSEQSRLFPSLCPVCLCSPWHTLEARVLGPAVSIPHVALLKTILATSCSVNRVLCTLWEARPNIAQGHSVFFSLEISCQSNSFNWLLGEVNYIGKEIVN